MHLHPIAGQCCSRVGRKTGAVVSIMQCLYVMTPESAITLLGMETMSETTAVHGLEVFPALRDVADPVWQRVLTSAQVVVQPAGKVLFRDGDVCQYYLLMLEGVARVQKVSEEGHEIVLYRIHPGQICELTTSCLLADADYSAEAVAETEVRVLLIPRVFFYEAVTGSPGFRKFVFSSIDQGMHELVHLIEEVAFGHVDRRLAHHLLDLVGAQHSLCVTHYNLAAELGTAREVVSRQLKEFERHGWVRLHRGKVDILDRAALQVLAARHRT